MHLVLQKLSEDGVCTKIFTSTVKSYDCLEIIPKSYFAYIHTQKNKKNPTSLQNISI